MSALDDLIAAANLRGHFINNLCQLDSGKWRAAVRDGLTDNFYGNGAGDTPVEALTKALAMAPDVAGGDDSLDRGISTAQADDETSIFG